MRQNRLGDKQDAPGVENRAWVALAVLMLPVLLVSVDNTVLAFALPEISEQLRPSGAQLLWIVDAYPLVLAGLLVSMGSLGDRIGRRRLLLIGSTGFTITSALAALMPDATMLIAARALMGFFGAMLMPSTLSLIRNIFTEQRNVAPPLPSGLPDSPVVQPWAPLWADSYWNTSTGVQSSSWPSR